MKRNGIIIALAVTPIVAFLGFGGWVILFSKDDSGFRVVNDTDREVRVAACSQNRPAFPGLFDIKPHSSVLMGGDWLPADDPGAACFIASPSTAGKVAFHGCLKMPTRDDIRDEFNISEADQSMSQRQCLDLSKPGFP
ncbi:hypothetical protein [Streptomyces sp. 900105755]